MSGGQKSRLVLAAALWGKPHIIALVRTLAPAAFVFSVA